MANRCLECGCVYYARGRCKQHYDALWRSARKAGVSLPRPTLIDRFWPKVSKRGLHDCWPWQAFCDDKGYGRFQIGRRSVTAHRVAWELTHGPLEPGLVVRHFVCDNPPCCNPAHLRPGSHGDNMRDMVAHERQARGERAHTAQLRPADVRTIRELRRTVGPIEIARRYGVHRQTIYRILTGKTWAHVT